MTADTLDYPDLVREALRDVPRRALEVVAEHGLPGAHHFYLSFRTAAPEVEIPESLREQHPEEMTVVLQHQFWDLEVDRERFAVTLSFGGQPARLSIPFEALTAFVDPAGEFGLRFVPEEPSEEPEEASGEDPEPAEAEEGEPERPAGVVSLEDFRKR